MAEQITHSPRPGQSPTPRDTKVTSAQMAFPDAMKAVIDEQKITKVEWGNPRCYCVLRNGFLMIYTDTWHTWLVSEGDMLGEDWIIIE